MRCCASALYVLVFIQSKNILFMKPSSETFMWQFRLISRSWFLVCLLIFLQSTRAYTLPSSKTPESPCPAHITSQRVAAMAFVAAGMHERDTPCNCSCCLVQSFALNSFPITLSVERPYFLKFAAVSSEIGVTPHLAVYWTPAQPQPPPVL
jgi:hypothetical protein